MNEFNQRTEQRSHANSTTLPAFLCLGYDARIFVKGNRRTVEVSLTKEHQILLTNGRHLDLDKIEVPQASVLPIEHYLARKTLS